MEKKFTRSETFVRRPFDMPKGLGELLKAAGVEHRAPEDVGGLLFGCLAHLSVGVATQYPEHWPVFRGAFVIACDDLRDVLTADDPAAVMRGIMERQKQERASMAVGSALALDRTRRKR